MWPLHDRQKGTHGAKTRDLCLVYLVHQVRAGESFDGNMPRQVPASATAAGGWVDCNKGGCFPARRSSGGGWRGATCLLRAHGPELSDGDYSEGSSIKNAMGPAR